MPEAPSQTLAAPVAIAGQAPGIGAFSAPPTIVCNPSQANAREVNSYQSMLDACATLKSVGASPGMAGPRVLALDSANGVIIDVTSNVYDPGPNYEIRGILTHSSGTLFDLTLGGSSFAEPPSSLRNVIISSPNNTTIWTIDLAGKNVTIDLYDSILNGGAPGAATMVFVDSVGGGNAQINLHGNSQLADYAIDWTSAQAAGSELNVLMQDISSVIGLAITPILSGLTITACSPGVEVDSSFYPNLEIQGLFVDPVGTGLGTIPGFSSDAQLLFSGGGLYVSQANSWLRVTGEAKVLPVGVADGVFPVGINLVQGVSTLKLSGSISAGCTLQLGTDGVGISPTHILIDASSVFGLSTASIQFQNGSLGPIMGSIGAGIGGGSPYALLYFGGSSYGVVPLGGGSGGGGTLVFQPNGVAGGNVYTDEGQLAAAVAAISGPVTVFFDLSLSGSSYTFTTAGNLNFGTNCTWTTSTQPGGLATLNFTNQTTLSYPVNLSGPLFVVVNQTTPVITIQPPSSLYAPVGAIELSGRAQVYAEGGSFIQYAAGTQGTFNIFLRNESQIGGLSSSVTFLSNVANDSYITNVYVEDGATIIPWAFDGFESLIIAIRSSGAYVAAQYYGYIDSITGLYVDTQGGAESTILPGGFNAGMAAGSTLFSGGVLYYTNGAEWIATGGAGETTAVVFQPGSFNPQPPVFNDPATMISFVRASSLPVTVFLDFSLSSNVYTWSYYQPQDVLHLRLVGLPSIEGVPPTFTVTGDIGSLEVIQDVNLVINTSIVTDTLWMALRGSTTISFVGGVGLTDVASGQTATWIMEDSAVAGQNTWNVDGSGTATINISGKAFLQANAVNLTDGAAPGQVTINAESFGNLDPSFFLNGYVVHLTNPVDPVLVFQPGGPTPGNNIFTDEQSLSAACTAANSALTIFFDLSYNDGPYTFQTNGTLYLGQYSTWTDGGVGSTLMFTVTYLSYAPVRIAGGLSLQILSSSASAFTTNTGVASLVVDEQASIINTTNSFVLNSGTYTVELRGNALIETSAAYVFYNNSATPGALTIKAYDNAVLVDIASYNGGAGASPPVIEVLSPAVTATIYDLPYIVITGLYVDPTSAAISIVSATTSTNAIIASGNPATFYQSNGTTWVALGGSGSSGIAPPITFQPGGTTQPNVFTSEASLATAFGSLYGPQTVYIDLSQSGDNFTTGQANNFGGYVVGVPDQATNQIPSVQTSQQIQNFLEMRDLQLNITGGPTFPNPQYYFRMTGASALVSGDGSSLFTTSAFAIIELHDTSSLGTASGEPSIAVPPGGSLRVYMFDESSIQCPSFTIGSGGSVTIVVCSTACIVNAAQAGVTILLNTNAFNLGYSPTSPSNWSSWTSVPTTGGEALDSVGAEIPNLISSISTLNSTVATKLNPTSVTGTGFWYTATGTLHTTGITFTGDVSQGALSGNNVPLTVTALQGHSVSSTVPTTNYVLTWNGSAWAPAAASSGGNTTVAAVQALGSAFSGTLTISNADSACLLIPFSGSFDVAAPTYPASATLNLTGVSGSFIKIFDFSKTTLGMAWLGGGTESQFQIYVSVNGGTGGLVPSVNGLPTCMVYWPGSGAPTVLPLYQASFLAQPPLYYSAPTAQPAPYFAIMYNPYGDEEMAGSSATLGCKIMVEDDVGALTALTGSSQNNGSGGFIGAWPAH